MESSACGPNFCHISLKEILELQEHAVTEEHAWALCYQLCTLLERCSTESVGSNDTLQNPCLPGADAILILSDGSVRFQGTFDSVVEQLGRLIYYCLDWGIDSDSERELSDALAHLLCRMIKISPCTGQLPQATHTLPEVIQACAGRLGDDVQAAHHYKTVCSSLFSETIKLYHCIQSLKSCSKSLQTLLQSNPSMSNQDGSDKVFAWKHVVQELQTGISLRPCEKTVPSRTHHTPEEQFPFDRLNQDIKCKRYSLHKRSTRGGKSLQMTDMNHALFEAIKSRPKLKPVSERKLRAKPAEEPCLHERLMAEIRTTDPQKLFVSCKSRCAAQSMSSSELTCPKSISWVQLASNLNVEGRKRRIQSLESYPYVKQPRVDRAVGSVGVTIKMIMNAHQTKTDCKQNETNPSKWQVCSCCFKQSHFFTWHNICSRCDRVVCPHCCVKMQVPYKWCMELPIAFFRPIVLSPNAEGDHSHFWRERLSWDCAKVPLVLEPQVLGSCSQHSLAMRDWHCQDICIECRGLLEEACVSGAVVNRVTGTLEI
ncbi:hypothetical protein ACEWY4_000852 [Coilia grayii]|uniref:KIND domain-containing protein n=1 Tax=Coilia grayii TaxID=363190 RepID=A0ABD1KXW4_9TELE